MRKLSVAASRNYDILIENGLLSQLGSRVKALGKIQTVALVSETSVYPLFGAKAEESLKNAGLAVKSFVFPAGEASKCADTYLRLLRFLAENHLTRTDAIVALGGGVVGDLSGFAAATYLRGIRFVQVPTTLLAAVDSSVGGKSIFRDGCAEVIKCAILFDRAFFDYLAETGMAFDREYVIERCVAMKRDVVDRDEFDVGARKLLNLGHTFGHSVEANSRFTLSHGQSVAIGTAIISRAAVKKGLLSAGDCARILEILKAYGLPTGTADDPGILADIALSDKKRCGGTLDLIVPEAIGRCRILPVPVKDTPDWVRAGM